MRSYGFAAGLASLSLAGSGHAQPPNIFTGTCGRESFIAEGPIGSDLTKRQSRFFCDSAVVTLDIEQGRGLFQFAEKRSNATPGLGFSGPFSGERTFSLDTVYFNSAEKEPAAEGLCGIEMGRGGKPSRIYCVVTSDHGGRRAVARVEFAVKN